MTVTIPVEEFDALLFKIEQGLLLPNNVAATAMAKIAVKTLSEYSPTVIEAEFKKLKAEGFL